MITRLDLDVLEMRANAATPGPWHVRIDTGDPDSPEYHVGAVDDCEITWNTDREYGGSSIDPADAEFVVAARTAVPQHLALASSRSCTPLSLPHLVVAFIAAPIPAATVRVPPHTERARGELVAIVAALRRDLDDFRSAPRRLGHGVHARS
jgi:hypothetical protein